MCAIDKKKHAIHSDLEAMRNIKFMPMILYQNTSFSLSGYLKRLFIEKYISCQSHLYNSRFVERSGTGILINFHIK